MNDAIDPSLLGPEERFAIGQPVPRNEDPILLRGEGRYTDDVSLPGQAYGVMVRSRHAHGVIRGIDTAAARAMPGVLGGLYRCGPDRRRVRAAAGRHGRQEPRRHARC